jgi:hypothetical protein
VSNKVTERLTKSLRNIAGLGTSRELYEFNILTHQSIAVDGTFTIFFKSMSNDELLRLNPERYSVVQRKRNESDNPPLPTDFKGSITVTPVDEDCSSLKVVISSDVLKPATGSSPPVGLPASSAIKTSSRQPPATNVSSGNRMSSVKDELGDGAADGAAEFEIMEHILALADNLHVLFARYDAVDDLHRKKTAASALVDSRPPLPYEKVVLTTAAKYSEIPYKRVWNSALDIKANIFTSTVSPGNPRWCCATTLIDESASDTFAWLWESESYAFTRAHISENGHTMFQSMQVPESHSKIQIRTIKFDNNVFVISSWWMWSHNKETGEFIIAFAPAEDMRGDPSVIRAANELISSDPVVSSAARLGFKGFCRLTPCAPRACRLTLMNSCYALEKYSVRQTDLYYFDNYALGYVNKIVNGARDFFERNAVQVGKEVSFDWHERTWRSGSASQVLFFVLSY